MMHDLAWLNSLTNAAAAQELSQCCGSKRWADEIAKGRPYESLDALFTRADRVWQSLDKPDWLEAFRSHPKIGEQKAALKVSAQSQQWSGQEQSGIAHASHDMVNSLAALNQAYERKFGYIFIICATGKTPDEMLAALRERLEHPPENELPIAAAEQSKITRLRLKKLLTSA